MTRRRVAVIGAGMTLFRRRLLETGRELSYEASAMALDAAGMERKDIESVVIGTAPDAFDGVHMKGEYLLEGAGGIGAPTSRVYVGGGTGVFSPDRRVVARRLGALRHVHGRRGGEDVAAPPAPAVRVLEHLRPHAGEAARGDAALDIRARDEAIHARLRDKGGGHRARGGQEQAQRARPPLRAAGGEDNRGRRDEEREDCVSGETPTTSRHPRTARARWCSRQRRSRGSTRTTRSG